MKDRDLDLEVAEKLMGYRWEDWETGRGFYAPDGFKVAKRFKDQGMKLIICDINGSECVPTRPLPEFSTRISDAWQVVEELRRRFGSVDIQGSQFPWRLSPWQCKVGTGIASVTADTAEIAICRAALEAMKKE